uniref:Helicase-associated domain-containing protein n=1 Tax=Proboscia inermis TaxID=420281 RepID=A0A7S0CEN6_9STRA
MTPQRIALLNKIGFVWDCHDYIYTKWLAELKLYAKEHHTSTHPPYKDPKYRKLSLWCRHQRLFYRQQQLNLNDEDKYNAIKNNYSRCLTPERIRMLNETGFEWLSARYCKTGFALEWDVLVAQINKELPKMKSFQDTIDEIDMSTAEDDVFSLWDEEEDDE